LVEEGPNIDTATIDSNSTEAISRLYRAGGMTPILGDQSIAYVEGRCVGGSTEINSGFWHRLPPDCYHRWKTEALLEAFTPDMMERYFERVEADLHVSLLGSCPEPKSSALFRQGIERLHWDYAEVPRCQKDPSASAFARGAKQSMQRTYIPRALRAGARLIASCKVRRIIYEDGRAVGVHAALTEGGRTTLQTIKADTIFVCCGAVQTPALLRRSGIRKHIGNNLCIHPMIKAAALFEDDVDAQDAPLPIYQVKEFGPTIAIGGAVFTPGFLAMILSDNWEANRDGMQNWRRMALYYAGTRGTNRGSIRVLPGTDDGVVIRYHLTGADQRNLSIGLARLGELLFAAGATAVYPSVRGLPVLRSVEQCRSLLKNYIPLSSMGLSTVHAFSSAPMGENPDFCATDSFGRVKGFSNLYINDASLIPDSPGVNPQATTMVIALRNIEHFAEASRRTAKARQTCPCKADVLITGAPGWLGSRLVEIFYNRNGDSGLKIDLRTRNVRCLVQATTDPSVLRQISDAVEIVRGDLTDPESVREFCRNAEGATLFHIAGLIHPKRATKEFYQVNVEGTRQVIEAAQNARVKRIVAVSSNSCIGCNPHPDHLFAETSPYNPYMHYGRSKMQMERLVNAAHARGNIETVIIRAPWFYGPHQPLRQTLFFRMIKEGKFPILGNGEQKRSMAYVDNICQGLLLAATVEEADGQTYWIADERPYTISEIVDTVESIMEEELGIKCSKKRLRLPPIIGDVAWLCDFGLQSIGFYNQKIHVLSEMNKTIACSIEKAMAELGYRPRYSLREGMAESLRWCVANGHQI
jgi:nucleoside-diphosphate-sugar epimerase/choline dehydrogenase-like flavoprotein